MKLCELKPKGMSRMNTELAIYGYMDTIIESVTNNQVTVLTADTGTGKSTQVPQYLHSKDFRVIVTEPRRVSAITLANRVREEMGEAGTVVGYHTGFESDYNSKTEILFCTDGLQLVKTLKSRNEFEDGEVVLVIDEIHEWNLNVEVLLAWAKREIESGSKMKIVIMSATMDAEAISEYFMTSVNVIHIVGKTFEVTWFHEPRIFPINTKQHALKQTAAGCCLKKILNL